MWCPGQCSPPFGFGHAPNSRLHALRNPSRAFFHTSRRAWTSLTVACALGQKACRDGYSVVYRRASRLFDELAQARADGTHPHVLKRLAKAQVLILDDFGLEPLGSAERKELLEVLEDRYHQSSTVVTSQLEPKDWHAVIGDATLADAILDRLVHHAHRLRLAGDSIRKADANLTKARKQARMTRRPSVADAPTAPHGRNGCSA